MSESKGFLDRWNEANKESARMNFAMDYADSAAREREREQGRRRSGGGSLGGFVNLLASAVELILMGLGMLGLLLGLAITFGPLIIFIVLAQAH